MRTRSAKDDNNQWNGCRWQRQRERQLCCISNSTRSEATISPSLCFPDTSEIWSTFFTDQCARLQTPAMLFCLSLLRTCAMNIHFIQSFFVAEFTLRRRTKNRFEEMSVRYHFFLRLFLVSLCIVSSNTDHLLFKKL